MIVISLSVKFNDIELNEYITVTTGFTRGIGVDRAITVAEIGNSDGESLMSSKLNSKSIDMPFILLRKSQDKMRKLASILDETKPKKLIFGDEPDKYYLAIPSTHEDLDEMFQSGKGTITWYCSDPFAYSIDEETFSNYQIAKGKNLILDSQFNSDNSGWQNGIIATEKYGTSNVFQCDNTAGGSWYSLVNTKIARQVVEVKKGDTVSWSLTERTKRVGKNGAGKTFCALVEEYAGVDTPRTHYQANQNFSDSGEWETLKSSYQIVGEDTKYISLTMMYVSDSDGLVQITEPMLVVGNEVPPYEKSPLDDPTKITIENNGTYKTPVNFEITNTSDNGYVGLVNETGIIQEGNPDEIDGADFTKLDTLMSNSFSGTNELDSWKTNTVQPYYPYNKVLSGSFERKKGINQDWMLHTKSFADGGINQMWYGPSIYKEFANNSNGTNLVNDFKLDSFLYSKSTGAGSMGLQELSIIDEDGKPLCGFYFRKLSWGDNKINLYMYVGNTIFQTWENANQKWINNFFGNINITRTGNDFHFTLRNLTNKAHGGYHYYSDEFGQKKAKGVVYYTGMQSKKPVFEMQLFNLSVKSTTSGWNDIKNMFSNGDVLTIESTDKAVRPYLNGGAVFNIQDIGTTPILAPPGISTITIANSTFSDPVQVKATIRERWL